MLFFSFERIFYGLFVFFSVKNIISESIKNFDSIFIIKIDVFFEKQKEVQKNISCVKHKKVETSQQEKEEFLFAF